MAVMSQVGTRSSFRLVRSMQEGMWGQSSASSALGTKDALLLRRPAHWVSLES